MKWFARLFNKHKCTFTDKVEVIQGVKFIKCDNTKCKCYDLHPDEIKAMGESEKRIEYLTNEIKKARESKNTL